MPDCHEISSLIRKRSSDLGFDSCGLAKAGFLANHKSHLNGWLDRGLNAEMAYMEQNLDIRLDPSLLVEGAKSVIIVSQNYYNDPVRSEEVPVFSKYAFGHDYHKILKDKLYVLLDDIKASNNHAEGRVFVDSAPLLERAWAVESGMGWIGKNSMLISKKSGSYIFLGAIVCNIALEYDRPESNDFCGSCTKCLDACPNSAITEDRTIDSNKCISYLSIEKKGDFKDGTNIQLHGNIFGCDICQDVCPWNLKVKPTSEKSFTPLTEIIKYSKDDWEKISEDDFNTIFRDSPVLRTGYSGFMRNLKHV
jgi:epoxyqueuosine reductase